MLWQHVGGLDPSEWNGAGQTIGEGRSVATWSETRMEGKLWRGGDDEIRVYVGRDERERERERIYKYTIHKGTYIYILYKLHYTCTLCTCITCCLS